MKTTTPVREVRRKELPDGHYVILERRVRVNRNGIRQATPWSIIYQSRTGY